MRTYELMVIHRSDLAEDDVRSLVDELEKGLTDNGAEVTATDFWGKRRFAYEIDHMTEGYYTVVTFDGEPGAVELLDRALSLADPVVRHKFIRPEAR